MTQETTNDNQSGQDEPVAEPQPDAPQPPAPGPMGWDPYAPPPAPAPAPVPVGWDPYAPPSRPVPMGWDPYAPPSRPVPMGWDPYAPPPNGHTEQPAPPQTASGGWVHRRAITHLWSSDESPGVWVAVHGAGWKRLSPASDSGHSHLTLLALLARNYQLPVSYHEDSHGQIDQLVV